MSFIEQRTWRYSYLLWEFWKKDTELFPDEISDSGLESRPHALIFVFDGSVENIPNNNDEVEFYKNVLQKARARRKAYWIIL